jgi:hypothetical protein
VFVSEELVSNLTHYWPISNQTAHDIRAGKNLYSQNPCYVSDRFGNPSSAFRVTNSTNFFQAPSDYYFSSEFTFILWSKYIDYSFMPRIFDFGNGIGYDNVAVNMVLSDAKRGATVITIFNNQTYEARGTGVNVAIDRWAHYAFTFKNNTIDYYVNGTSIGKGPIHSPRKVIRTSNYLGKSHWDEIGPGMNDYDEIKIYDRALNDAEVMNDMMGKYTKREL